MNCCAIAGIRDAIPLPRMLAKHFAELIKDDRYQRQKEDGGTCRQPYRQGENVTRRCAWRNWW